MHTEWLTLIGSAETVGSKTFTAAGVTPYNAPYGPYVVRRYPVDSLEAAARVLLECPPNAFVIRGKPIGDADQLPYRRHRSKPGEPAALEGEAHHLLPVDIDADDGRDGRDLQGNAKHARSLLPEPFRAARCFAMATSSAGVKPGSRLRLWFWGHRPANDRELKVWLREHADTSIYTPSQPIYCAAPVFQGVPDPMEGRPRSVWLEGRPDVAIPDDLLSRKSEPAVLPPGFALSPAEGRNTSFTSLAGTMRRRGLGEEAISAALQEHNRTLVEPLPVDEVDAIARSVGSYEPEAIVPPKRDTKASQRAVKAAHKALSEDPALLPEVAARLAAHVRTGALSEGQALTALSRGLDAAPVATSYARDDLARVLASAPPLEEPTRPSWATEAICDEDGNPICCPENLRLLLAAHPEISLWHDSRGKVDHWERVPWRQPGPVAPTDDFALRAWVSAKLGWHKLGVPPTAAIAEVARYRAWDPWRGHLERLEWDGTPRVEAAAPRLLGCPDTETYRTIFAWWLISAVARTFEPGCQVDHLIVLEGEQGEGKTSLLRTLAYSEAFFTRLTSGADLNHPRTIGRVHGPVIVELAELAFMRRAEVEAVKAFVDERVDRVQWLYTSTPVNEPRTCVFAATTNESVYLRDVTGARRFWPIPTGRIDLELATEVRDQVWAEAVALYRAGCKWWPTKTDTERLGLRALQESRRQTDPMEDKLAEILDAQWTPGRHALSGAVVDAAQLDETGRFVYVALAQLCDLAGLNATREGAKARTALTAMGWAYGRGDLGGRSGLRVWRRPASLNDVAAKTALEAG